MVFLLQFHHHDCRDDKHDHDAASIGQGMVFHANELTGDEDERTADEGHKHSREDDNPAVGLLARHIYYDGPEHDGGQSLIGPGEVTPNNVEIDQGDAVAHDEERDTDVETLQFVLLVDVEHISNDESRGTKGCIA